MLEYAPVPTTPSISGTRLCSCDPVALRETAGDDQMLIAPSLREACSRMTSSGFFFRRIDERAGIDHDRVRALRFGLEAPPRTTGELRDHHLGVDEGFRTAQFTNATLGIRTRSLPVVDELQQMELPSRAAR